MSGDDLRDIDPRPERIAVGLILLALAAFRIFASGRANQIALHHHIRWPFSGFGIMTVLLVVLGVAAIVTAI